MTQKNSKSRCLFLVPLLVVVFVAQAQQSLYVDTHLPNSHPLKKELVDKLQQSGKVKIVTLPGKADLVLELDETGRSLGTCTTGIFVDCGHRGRALLKARQTGEELWSEEKGGGWQWSGWSAGMVGRKLGNDLVKFLSQYATAHGARSENMAIDQEARAPNTSSAVSDPNPSSSSVTPNPQAPVATPASRSKESAKMPGPKCAQGTYWGDDASGNPICVWSH